ncbi:translation initiation factor IF-2-like [Equus quagga]|uniref:translation initiation factor IF-2-like n=1 Tax=Equus quagga TaxID=89248 RepID=UPI001EE2C0BF|nr:translation initiation factor IF-2-like [Equus quagga]
MAQGRGRGWAGGQWMGAAGSSKAGSTRVPQAGDAAADGKHEHTGPAREAERHARGGRRGAAQLQRRPGPRAPAPRLEDVHRGRPAAGPGAAAAKAKAALRPPGPRPYRPPGLRAARLPAPGPRHPEPGERPARRPARPGPGARGRRKWPAGPGRRRRPKRPALVSAQGPEGRGRGTPPRRPPAALPPGATPCPGPGVSGFPWRSGGGKGFSKGLAEGAQ